MKKWKVPRTASRGFAIGPAFAVKRQHMEFTAVSIEEEQVEQEIMRFLSATEKAQAELTVLAEKSDIFAAHAVLAGDIAIRDGVAEKIRSCHISAENAMTELAEEYIRIFESMDDEYMRERAADMKDVSKRIIYALQGKEDDPFSGMRQKSIIVAEELTPSDTAKMNADLVLGFAMEEGGITSHISIMAKTMSIPCLVGAGPLLNEIHTGDMLILDAAEGMIFQNPDPDTLEMYVKKKEKYESAMDELQKCIHLPAQTKDGHTFSLYVNVGNTDDIRQSLQVPTDGAGLFRTEFLYMENDHFPGEEEQFAVYKNAALLLKGKELTIRTLDIGGDKGLPYFEFPREENPFLGYRAIRMCLDREDIFKTQLRAILRASAFGNIRIMYPMITSLWEFQKANELLALCKEELRRENTEFDENIRTGIMVETPSAVLLADELAREADFFSIGTNDLTQYILAADRGNPKIAFLYDPFHPAVQKAIYHTIRAGHRHGIPVGMCGELASDLRAVPVLLGMGLDEFSMSCTEILPVKNCLCNCVYQQEHEKVVSLFGKTCCF